MPRVSIGDEDDDAFRPQFSNSFKICCNFQKTIYWSTILCTANSPLTTLLLLRSSLFWQKKYLYLALFRASNPGCDLRSQLLKKLLLHSIVIILFVIISYCNHISTCNQSLRKSSLCFKIIKDNILVLCKAYINSSERKHKMKCFMTVKEIHILG